MRLGALEHDAVAAVHPAREQERRVGDVRGEPARVAQVLVQDLLDREGLGVVDLAQQAVLLGDVQLELLAEQPLVQEVGHADADARRLVDVGGPDAAPGRADPALAELGLGGEVERRVVRHDQVRVLRDEEVAVERHPATYERLHLLDERARIHDDAAADDAAAARMQDARRNRVQDVLLAPDDDGVARVVPPGVARDDVHVRRQQIDHLPLALVAPLRSDDHDVRHGAHLQIFAPDAREAHRPTARAPIRPRGSSPPPRRRRPARDRRPGRDARAGRARRRPTRRVRG